MRLPVVPLRVRPVVCHLRPLVVVDVEPVCCPDLVCPGQRPADVEHHTLQRLELGPRQIKVPQVARDLTDTAHGHADQPPHLAVGCCHSSLSPLSTQVVHVAHSVLVRCPHGPLRVPLRRFRGLLPSLMGKGEGRRHKGHEKGDAQQHSRHAERHTSLPVPQHLLACASDTVPQLPNHHQSEHRHQQHKHHHHRRPLELVALCLHLLRYEEPRGSGRRWHTGPLPSFPESNREAVHITASDLPHVLGEGNRILSAESVHRDAHKGAVRLQQPVFHVHYCPHPRLLGVPRALRQQAGLRAVCKEDLAFEGDKVFDKAPIPREVRHVHPLQRRRQRPVRVPPDDV
eukprot:Sspe_Gene.71077::Locus_42063_Transcript_1_1_Confidence_1.000_Length_2201::g.71077::m.71077